MAGVPTILHVALVWVTALASIALSFTTWDGIGLADINWVGLDNFRELFTNYPQFWPAVQHNVIWFSFSSLIPTPFGLFLAFQLDKKIRFSRVYQTAFFLPVVVSLAVIGFVWQLVYNPDTGLINSLIGATEPGHYIDWIGDPHLNLWAVLVAACWRHTGYMMILYLAGLKGVDARFRTRPSTPGIDVFMECTITRLLKDGERVAGAFSYRRATGEFVVFAAPRSSSPPAAPASAGASPRTRGSAPATGTRWRTRPARS